MKVITIKFFFTVTFYSVLRNKYVCVWINYSQTLEENKIKLRIQKIYSEHFTNKTNISLWRSQQYGYISSYFCFLSIFHVVYSPFGKKIYPLWQVLIFVGYLSTNPAPIIKAYFKHLRLHGTYSPMANRIKRNTTTQQYFH